MTVDLPVPFSPNEEGDRRRELDIEAANERQAERIFATVCGALFQLDPNEVRW